jgi:tetratricopeptide (TPR) repeat protein
MFSISSVSVSGVSVNNSATRLGSTINILSINPARKEGSPSAAPLGFPQQLTVPWHSPAAKPSIFGLMSWHARLSDFVGNEDQINELLAWVQSPQPVSIKFICGDGGVGKSRLAAELAQTMHTRDWAAGFVDLQNPKSFVMGTSGTLLVVDYPEEYTSGVAALLRDVSRCGTEHLIRLLFITRRPMDRWREVIYDSGAAAITEGNSLELPDVTPRSAEKLFHSVQERACELLRTTPRPVGLDALTDWLSMATEHRRPLFIVSAAIYSAVCPDDDVVKYSGPEVVKALVEWELTRLRRVAVAHGIEDRHILAGLFSAASIADPLPLDDLERLTLRCPAVFANVPMRRVVEGATGECHQIYGIKPDIVAAAFVLLTLARNSASAPEFLLEVVRLGGAQALLRLARIDYDASVVLGIRDERVSVWLERAVSASAVSSQMIVDLLAEVQVELPVGLLSVAVAARRRLLREASLDDDRADHLLKLATYLRLSGEQQAALHSAREADRLYSALTMRSPKHYATRMLESNRQLAASLLECGDAYGAVHVSHAGVNTWLAICEQNPGIFDHQLVSALGAYSSALFEAGQPFTAKEVLSDAEPILRRLVAAQPAKYEGELASLLMARSSYEAVCGPTEAAVKSIREAEDIYEALALKNPYIYQHDYVQCLAILANRLLEARDYTEAIRVAEHAETILRPMVLVHRSSLESDLERLLNNLAYSRFIVHDFVGALGASAEAIEIFRRVMPTNKAGCAPHLAQALRNRASALASLERYQEAAELMKESVTLYRPSADANPTKFARELARSLHNYAVFVAETGDLQNALETASEAVEIRERLVEETRSLTEDVGIVSDDVVGLSLAYEHAGTLLERALDYAGAVEATDKACMLVEHLSQRDPYRFSGHLTRVQTQRDRLRNLGQTVKGTITNIEA